MSSNKEEPKKPAPASSSPPSKPSTTTTAKPPAKPAPPATAKPPATAAAKPVPAAPSPKKEPEPPAFEKGLADQVKKRFGESIKVVFIRPLRIKIQVDPKDTIEVATFLRDTMGFDHAESSPAPITQRRTRSKSFTTLARTPVKIWRPTSFR